MNTHGESSRCRLKGLTSLACLFLFTHHLGRAAPPHGNLRVLPSEVPPIVVFAGDTQSIAGIVLYIQNTGPGALHWAVSADANWIEFSSNGGHLRAGQQSAVALKLRDISALPIGRYTATVVFTSLNHKSAPVVREIVLDVRLPAPAQLPAPIFFPETQFTASNPHTVYWSTVTGANEYEVQSSTNNQFANSVSSGWLPYATNYTFSNLNNDSTYFYRVHCRSNYIAWSQTLAQDFAGNLNSNVTTITSPGDLVLIGNTNRMWFENFDEPGTNWSDTIFNNSNPDPSDWEFGRGPLDESLGPPNTRPPLPINLGGDKEGFLFSEFAYMTNSPENQFQDVTVDAYIAPKVNAPQVEAGVILRGDPFTTLHGAGYGYYANVAAWGSWHWVRFGWLSNSIFYHFPILSMDTSFPVQSAEDNFHLRFSASGTNLIVQLWEVSAANGIIYESPVRFAATGGNILIASDTLYSKGIVGLTTWGGNYDSPDAAFFDDITVRPDEFPPHYVAAGSSTAVVAPASWIDHWGELSFSKVEPPGTRLSVDVLDRSGHLLAANVSSGTDLQSLPAVAQQGSLQLRANLLTSDPSETPTLSDWTILFPPPARNPTESPWSDVVNSTIDTTPPVLTITSPDDNYVTATNVVTFTGTASDDISGIVRVHAQAIIAATTNHFANWTLTAPLRAGTNLFFISAQDNVLPTPNRTTIPRQVIYLP